ncbi:MAG: triacylglycerol lipase [Corynebacterium sp.]|nr:triacylglycerol lipase [Corynebacterium sp.]
MAFLDPHRDIRAIISAQLGTFLDKSPLSEMKELRKSPRIVGSRTQAPASALREDVAAEIVAMLKKRHGSDGFFDMTSGPSTRLQQATSNVALSYAGSGSPVNYLPLGARLKPRGIFEDDWTAKVTPQRPWAIILLHGSIDSKGVWQLLGGELRFDGWAVFAPDYGTRATGLIPDSAEQIAAYVEAVKHASGAEKVVVIGHSQGGLVARYWMRVLGGAHHVRHLICLGSPNHGTTQGGIISQLITTYRSDSVVSAVIDSFFGPAGAQQIVGSPLLRAINEGGDTDGGVTYTNIATKSDAVVVPPETCFLDPSQVKDGTVRNIYVQDFDKRAVVLHHDLPMDRRVRAIVRTIIRQLYMTDFRQP